MKINWRLAACRNQDPDEFHEPAYESLAKATCRRCPIKIECLTHALETGEASGVWGGLTERERTNLNYRRYRVKCPDCHSPDVNRSLPRTHVCRSCGLSWPM